MFDSLCSNSCKPGFTGRQCEHRTVSCSPDPCYPNGYCNSLREPQTKQPGQPDFVCRCKHGFSGLTCNENINDCLNGTCHNGGLCIDGINSYECECKWPYVGRYCETKLSCKSENACKNGGICVEDELSAEMSCICASGYQGIDCSASIQQLSLPPRRLTLTHGTRSSKIFSSHVTTTSMVTTRSLTSSTNSQQTDSLNNGSFVLIVNISPDEFLTRKDEIVKQFEKQFGILMLIKKEANTSNEMIYPFYPNLNSTTDITKRTVWTKVYFIIIFACVGIDSPNMQVNSKEPHVSRVNDGSSQLCLQRNVNNMNDVMGILNELNKWTRQLPDHKYISNVSYEAYADSLRRGQPTPTIGSDEWDESSKRRQPIFGNLTTFLVTCLILLLVGIILALAVLIRQNAKKLKSAFIKTPIWYPPMSGENYNDYASSQIKAMPMSMSLVKGEDSPPSFVSAILNDYAENSASSHRTITCSSSANSSTSASPASNLPQQVQVAISSDQSGSARVNNIVVGAVTASVQPQQQHPPLTPEFYPSPPESLPDSACQQLNNYQQQYIANKTGNSLLYPVNYKAASCGITPLMMFITGRRQLNYDLSSKGEAVIAMMPRAHSVPLNKPTVVEMVNAFVHNGADMNAQNVDGETALHLAVKHNQYDIVECLLKCGADLIICDKYGRNVIHAAAYCNQYEIMALLLNYCSSMINSTNNIVAPLSSSAATQPVDLSSPASSDCPSLASSISSSVSHANKLNVNANANISEQDLVLKRYDLIDSKTENSYEETSLIIAARYKRNNILKLLIDFKASLNLVDNEGKTALHHAASVNNKLAVELLLSAGANVNMQDHAECTPLTLALNELYTLEVCDMLIRHRANVSDDDVMKYNKKKTIVERMNVAVCSTSSSTQSGDGNFIDINTNQKYMISAGSNFSKEKTDSIRPNDTLAVKKKSNKLLSALTNNTNSSTVSTKKGFFSQISAGTKRKLCDAISSNGSSVSANDSAGSFSNPTKIVKTSSSKKQLLSESQLAISKETSNLERNQQAQKQQQQGAIYTPLTPSPPVAPINQSVVTAGNFDAKNQHQLHKSSCQSVSYSNSVADNSIYLPHSYYQDSGNYEMITVQEASKQESSAIYTGQSTNFSTLNYTNSQTNDCYASIDNLRSVYNPRAPETRGNINYAYSNDPNSNLSVYNSNYNVCFQQQHLHNQQALNYQQLQTTNVIKQANINPPSAYTCANINYFFNPNPTSIEAYSAYF
jgi:ankyrin repeat protein